MNTSEIATKEDIQNLKIELIRELSIAFKTFRNTDVTREREWLRTKEVRKLLGGISLGTLNKLRIKKNLTRKRVEGIYYFRLSELEKIFNDDMKSE
jgi:hypothetical protein